jgi:hypothetical protein
MRNIGADLEGVGLTAVGRLRHRRARIADESRSSRDGLFGSTRSSPEGLRVRGHLAGGNRIRTFGPAEGQDRPDRYSLLIMKSLSAADSAPQTSPNKIPPEGVI